MALDFPSAPTFGQKYPTPAVVGLPQYTWDGEKWTTSADAVGSAYVKKSGDVMSGNFMVRRVDPEIAVDAAGGGHGNFSIFRDGKLRWVLRMVDDVPETGGNVGSAFAMYAVDDAGTAVNRQPIFINRADGLISLAGDPTVPLHAATKNYVDNRLASPQAINVQTGTTYTLVQADAGKLIWMYNAAAITLTIPPDASMTLPIGTHIDLAQADVGQMSIAPGAGVTLISEDSRRKLTKQYSVGTLVKMGANIWLLTGSITT